MSRRSWLKQVGILVGSTAGARLTAAPQAALADSPTTVLNNGILRAEVLLPNRARSTYVGSRFDASTFVKQVWFRGHTYFTDYARVWNQSWVEQGIGLGAEFSMGTEGLPAPMGFEEAAAGGEFTKLGVGVLEKPDLSPHQFYHDYKLLDGGEWNHELSSDAVTCEHRLDNGRYPYVLRRTLRLAAGEPVLYVETSLTNRSQQRFDTSEYFHNFFCIDEGAVGPDYELELPFVPKPVANEAPSWKLQQNRISLQAEIKGKDAEFIRIAGFESDPAQHRFTLINRASRGKVTVVGRSPMAYFNIWATSTAFCPEPARAFSVGAGETSSWTARYEFGEENA